MALQVFLGLVFRILIVLIKRIAMSRLALALGNEIVFMDACLERTFIAVNEFVCR